MCREYETGKCSDICILPSKHKDLPKEGTERYKEPLVVATVEVDDFKKTGFPHTAGQLCI